MTNQTEKTGTTGGYRVTGFPGRSVFQDASGLVAGLPASASEGAGMVTLLQGVFANSDALKAWIKSVHNDSAAPSTLLVDRIDPTGAATLRWTLTNAVPTSLSVADVQSEGNEVAVESVEVAYETMVISAP
jgi:phage tail-like protein